jgi:dCMP deaminase
MKNEISNVEDLSGYRAFSPEIENTVEDQCVVGLNRPSWDEFWFTVALIYSTRATCDRLRTATVIVKNNKLVGAGYNGSPSGADHCDDVGHLMINGHCERTLHGEQNAIINTSREDLRGSTAYILGTPCLRCFKELVASGVLEVKCLGTYSNSLGKNKLVRLSKEYNVVINFFDYNPAELLKKSILMLKRKGGILHSS